MQYLEKKFDLPALDGISQKSVEEHLGLYEGYVKNFNGMIALMGKLMADPEENAHALSELERRLSFEFGGMRLHELYFAQWKGGAREISGGSLKTTLEKQYGSFGQVIAFMKNVGLMRGPGWALLYFDPEAKIFHMGFSGEQHRGHFVTLPVILALDVWEHAYILDCGAQGKGKYIDAFFKNLNWGVMEKRFDKASSQ
ncbi:hypothetical protein A2852_01105 [Candidatus Adlerbacteria bacterium RIFCSPHIGHO2_01_FULL_54_23]|uniref:superoxide dismutase n=3 Tax=Candidatus Adleribacteriota TaxID=1752736 RepID=A0A1F4Y0U6_9BACT|nr:MAG: Superoxide dismutase (Fe) [Candidatus Adlerbacteria bacterium GW2011_GWA1_54_10]KKW36208.1 MAG: Superoxide dismutase (Fe) [Candidatus Adlerbacteria bacterium GW2011_GWA2_54_12]KKW37340.1 MAG: Superoxide dismutase (Fe) [Candidatus Adlerbacteria bacterium GW2011_GWB1_54_7]OGC79438.1 MAG: hypothetical protein A2852_01105 [Candidatus Adlerbacteria bacterium RIFCSPHIGHO2_01_FULL_54_23]OGC87416.1 MAG: hypothetical protein A3B33_02055 [Candidatus Adlerbacteria bacterium RIFCSPLOWO2_01_FULL_54_